MDWKVGLPVLVGEKVWWMKNGQDQPKTGIIKWIGNIPEIESGWSIGLEMDEPLADGGCDGLWKNRKIFECQPKRGLIVPIQEVRKIPPPNPDFQTSGIEIRSNRKPKESETDESTAGNHGKNLKDKKSEKLELEDQYSSLKLKFGDRDWKNDPGETKRRSGVFKKCDKSILRLKQNHFLKSKVEEAKASLKNRKRKTHSLREYDGSSLSGRKFEEDLQLVRKSLDARSYFTINEFFENSNNSDSNVNMNDVAGYFKEIKEDEITNDALKKPTNECEKQLRGLLACDYPEPITSGQNKEKKFFSFLKWFKKNKENSNVKTGSVTSSPVLERKEHSSCESLDTIFSTQTVRSFAYIPPTQYQPSAPSSSLLGLDLVENGSRKDQSVHEKKKKKKRKAPDPPSPFVRRITRENSLPSTLDRKQDIQNGCETFHRRTVSESFKDKKAGAYCHVQGKRKAPLPPSKVPALYPDLQKVSPNYQSLQRKKKPAPLPPNQTNNDKTALEVLSKNEKSFGSPESPKYLRELNGIKSNEQGENSSLKVSSSPSSPLPSRPWYKRSQRDSGASKIFNKMDVLKGFEKKKNKETDDWMPEIGFPRRSFSNDVTHNKFTIFPKIDRPEERKKEEKRKSQISILTNISELDKEAAEILRKEQAEEKKMMAENDARYYSSPPIEKDLREKVLEEESTKKNDKTFEVDLKNNNPSENQVKNKKEIGVDYDKRGFENENNKIDFDSGMESKTKNDAVGNLNYFDVKNKQVRYLNEPWVCPKCTLENPGWRVFCEICSSVKPHFLYDCNKKSSDCDFGSKKPREENKEITENSSEPQTENPESNLNTDRVENKRNNFTTSKINNERMGEESSSKNIMTINDLSSKKVTEIHVEEKNKIKNVNDGEETRGFRKDGAKSESTERDKASEEQKCGAIKKQPIISKAQSNKNENNKVIEAYVITHTTVLEDIIIKKGDKAVEGPSRTTKNSPRGQSVKYKYLRPGENSSSTKKQEPIDLTPSGEDFGENLKELTKKLSQAEGLADFKAAIESMAPESGSTMNTVAVNKLLKKLETAIGNGDQLVAGGLAKELALLKINCSVTRQGAAQVSSDLNSKITVNMYVEDKMTHEGPIQVQVSPSMTLLQLKKRVHRELGIPVNAQRWILGKKLATDDYKTLESDGVKNDSCSVFLYVMSSGNNEIENEKSAEEKNSDTENLLKDDLSPFKRMQAENKEDLIVGAEKDEDEESNGIDDQVSGNLFKLKNSKSEGQANVPGSSTKGDNKSDRPPPSIFRLSSRDGENEVEKELKLISANSVKQKVEQLNKTFEENSRKEKSEKELNPTGSWKCLTCTYVNSAGRQICFACSAKKQDQKRKAEAPRIPKPLFAPTGASAPKPANLTKVENDAKSFPSNNFHYDELMKLQDVDIVSNSEPFYCTICLMDYSKGEGIVLKDCLHTFCRPCLINTVQYSEDAEVKCPYFDEKYSCPSVLQQREIKGLVPQKVFDQHLAKSVKEAENKIENAFHCKTADCKGWCIFEDNVNEFHCPVCNLVNCLTCHAIHTGINCKEYQQRMRDASDTDLDARKTREMLEEMVVKGEAMACPKCQIVLMKKWGCDWLRCSMCKTEICWVTRGFRWGPAGKGDISAGCKCGVNGIKCHPKCNYCH